MTNWAHVGKHKVRIEGDIFVSINDGPVSLGEMKAITEQLRKAVDERGVRFLMMNLMRAEAPSPEARRWMSQNPYQGVQAVAGYGASRALRFLSDLMRRAMDLLNPTNRRTPFRLFDTEADVLAYFDSLRKTSS